MHRVLHVINTQRSEMGGGGEHLLRLTDGLARHGYASAVVIGQDGQIGAQLRSVGLQVQAIGRMGALTPLRLARVWHILKPDVVHLHGSRAGFLGTMAARLSGSLPVIYTAHAFAFQRVLPGPIRWSLARMEAMTCARADRVICLSHGDVTAAEHYGIPATRMSVIPNGIDVARFDHVGDCRLELGYAPATPIVGMVARLVPQKDPLSFVALARQVRATDASVRFLLVGDGPLRPAVEAAVRREGLHGLEAMAAARPVVATLLPGTAEVVLDGVTGHLVPVGNLQRFVEIVVGLLQNPGARAEMGQRARERVRQDFSLARMIDRTVRTYEAAVASRPRSARA